jgi:hypothetical protein
MYLVLEIVCEAGRVAGLLCQPCTMLPSAPSLQPLHEQCEALGSQGEFVAGAQALLYMYCECLMVACHGHAVHEMQ